MNFITGELDGATGEFRDDYGDLKLSLGSFRNGPAKVTIKLGFRPEDAELASENGMSGRVVVEPLGPFTIVVVDSGSRMLKAMIKGQQAPAVGDTASLRVSPSRIAIFRRDEGQRIDFGEHRAEPQREQTTEAM